MAEDGDVFAFYLPGKTEDKKPVLGGGEFIAAFTDRPEVKAFQTYLSTDTWANNKAKATPHGGWVSANKGLDAANLVSPIDKLAAETFQDPKARLPLRRLRPDARRDRLERLLEAVHGLDHRPEHQGRPSTRSRPPGRRPSPASRRAPRPGPAVPPPGLPRHPRTRRQHRQPRHHPLPT